MPARSPVRIAVVSFFILLLELALIRLIPSEVKAISYFINLLVFSAFFGLGVGCILWRHKLPGFLFPAGLFLIALFVFLSKGVTIYETGGQVHYWLQEADRSSQPFFQMPLIWAAIVAFLVSAIPFVGLGWILSREMQGHARLKAYAFDLAGSFLGTVAFALIACASIPPWLLIFVTAVVVGLVFHREVNLRVFHVCAGLIFLLLAIEPRYSTLWSPYYFIRYHVDARGVTVLVNNSFHQEAINFQNDSASYKQVAGYMRQKFSLPYDVYRQCHQGRGPQKVLILGAGSGNDVNIALLNGVSSITAVEIDPQIARIGREFNPLHPYQDPRVKLIIDDGRHFLWNSSEQYDMVIFGTLDSQTLLSGQTNLRLDNYIYTTECFQDTRRRLRPDGMVASYYSVYKDWFYQRIYATMASAFPGSLRLFRFQDNYLFNAVIVAAREGVPGFFSAPAVDRQLLTTLPSSDDWPFIYLQFPTLSPLYLQVFGLIGVMIAIVFFLLIRREETKTLHLDFFFLGVGFSLMESAAIVRLALAFGTTWVVNAVVFATVLLTVFLANLLVELRLKIHPALAWMLLIAALAINFYFPVRLLLELSFPLRVLGAFALIGTPVFFAGVSFSNLFKAEPSVGPPFGMNMIGAMVGGSIEYLSMLLGMQNIWFILTVIYLVAWLCHRLKVRRIGMVAAVVA
jgi:hypothetical protein